MILSGFFRRLRVTLKALRRNRDSVRTLSHLDAHLLKDIGLHVEQGIVRPLYPENDVIYEPVPAPPCTESGLTESREARCDTIPTLCPSCGAPLA
ncbi:protein of unknown function [Modicisalibacter muralis]|uniref:YjiS-like domain-containing protein n=1 Tax=Modicisalibacter muralis TaxID=119000 RepID=A0A1G9I2Y1_9GAMM|nr:DUF1127 domain-containing protein [Halomonas muralis]SDL19600.1 protein of unknown function [Halomonas muralis]